MAEALKHRDEQLKAQAARKVMESERLAIIASSPPAWAHEINNPLTGIVTYSQLLLEKNRARAPRARRLQKIVTQGATAAARSSRGLCWTSRARASPTSARAT